MSKKLLFQILVLLLIFIQGCIKETFDMNKLSDEIRYSPAFSLSAVTGDITICDIVEPNDTIRFDNDNFVRIVFRKDSIFDLRLEDYYDFGDLVSHVKDYTIGEIMMGDFQDIHPVTLNTIRLALSDPNLRQQLLDLDDGSTHLFPAFPETTIPEQGFALFDGFQYAVLSSGTVEISVRNNLNTPLNDVKVRLYNSSGHTQIGSEMVIPAINPGATQNAVMSLAGKTITNNIVAAIVFGGSPGTSSQVIIDMDQSVLFTIKGYNLKAQSGRMKIPEQTINSPENLDTITFDPGDDIEVEKLRIETGRIDFHLVSETQIGASLSVELPSSLRNGFPVEEHLKVTPNVDTAGFIDISETEIDLSSDPKQQYNRIPVNYTIVVSSGGKLIDFNKNDKVHLEMEIPDPHFDYLKGYFGNITKELEEDTLDTGIREIADKISGDFHISDPSITVSYSNSFGVPVRLSLDAVGIKGQEVVGLDYDPLIADYPVSITNRIVNSSFTIDNENSRLDDIISLPPEEIRFSGSGTTNPQGYTRDNYIFGDSRFTGSLEVEIPLELWINDLQLSDTLDNFMKTDEDEEAPFSAKDLKLFTLEIKAENGFPLGASLKLILFDSLNNDELKRIDAGEIIKPAPVDVNGKAIGTIESTTTIDCDFEFFEAASEADKIIFIFSMKTSGTGTENVKIYSDYTLKFRTSFKIQPDLNPNR